MNEAIHVQAMQHYKAQRPADAARLCWQILSQEPLHVEAIYLLGIIALEAGESARAILHFHHASLLQPARPDFHHALAEAFRSAGRAAEAAKAYQEALRLDAQLVASLNGLGLARQSLGELDASVDCFRQSLALKPDQPRTLINLGQALHHKGEIQAAAECFAQALRLEPNYAIALNNMAVVLQSQGDFTQSATYLRRALAVQPNYPEAHCNLGTALRAQGDRGAAACYREAIRLRSDYAKAHFGLGQALADEGRSDDALASLQQALRLTPDYVEAIEQIGHLLLRAARWEAARPVFEKVLALQPDHAAAFACLVRIKELLCDWSTREGDFRRLRELVETRLARGEPTGMTPFNVMTMPWPLDLQLAIARRFSDELERPLRSVRTGLNFSYAKVDGGRLRVGYLSGTFHDHALLHLMQGLFGLHDRRDFEIFAYSYGPPDDSRYRQRVQRDCDHFRDLAGLSAAEAARCIHRDGIHLLVDLMGHTGGAREEIVALRPAPVQVSYIGFAGTMGASFIDYLITDPTVSPPELAWAYSEKLVHLPHCYLVNDHQQEIAPVAFRRADFQLPEGAFVMTSFNNCYKFEPEIFGTWMNILRAVPGSVLWLWSGGPIVEANLRGAARRGGVDPERLIFGQHRPKPEHLARLRLADLFVDTHFVNAHTGCSDALWAGLPVLTWPGETFASRVAASLVANVGLPELIARSREEYEQKAIQFAREPAVLQQLRARLAANRMTWPLFDTPRFTRNLERAYRAMAQLYAEGKSPQPIRISEPA